MVLYRKIFAAVIAVFLSAFVAWPSNAQTPSYQFGPSGMDAGGYQNVIAVDPNNPQIVLSGADVAGINRSTDGGAHWTLSNEGLETHPYLHVASVAFYSSNEVYIAVGNANGKLQNPIGGVFKSIDGGLSWKPFNLNIHIGGGNQKSPNLPSSTATLRSTGNLLAFSWPYLYVGSFDNGIYKCAMQTGDCAQIASTAGLFIRSIVIDPSDPTNTLFAAAVNVGSDAPYGLGVYKVSNLRSNTPSATLVGPPTTGCIEELAPVIGDSTSFYAVGANYVPDSADGSCGGDGVIYRVTKGGNQWTLEEQVSGVEFISVAAIVTERNRNIRTTTVLAGTLDHPATGHQLYYFNVVDGQSGIPEMTAGVPHNDAPLGGGSWWKYLTTNKLAHNNLMDNPGFAVSNIQIASDGRTVYLAGRAAVMASPDLGVNWYPAVHNMNVTFNHEIAADANGVYFVDTDWQFLYSQDQMRTVSQNAPVKSGSGDSVAILTNGSQTTVFAGLDEGDLYTTADVTSGKWVDENLAGGTVQQPVMGIAAKTVDGKTTILAALETSGMWRGVKSSATSPATWTQVLSAFNHDDGAASTDTAPIVWDQTRSAAYAYDRDYGVYRSQDDGATWSLVYPNTTEVAPSGWETGDLALDETTDTLYISNSSGLLYVSNASTAVDPFTPVQVPNSEGLVFGPIAFANNALYVTGPETNIPPLPTSNVYIYTPGGGTLTPIGDDFIKANGGLPDSIAVDGAGNIYLGMDGTGVLVGTPVESSQNSTTIRQSTKTH